MLSRINRITRSQEIYTIRAAGLRIFGKYITLFVQTTPEQTSPRFAFIISTKTAKNAVNRNRTKRLLREAVRSLLPMITPTLSVVCVAKADLSAVPLSEIKKELENLLANFSNFQVPVAN